MSKQLRVRAYSQRETTPGYVGYETVHYQDLQEKHWWGWKTLDTEVVPTHVRISLGAFGDNGGWLSKFASLGAFGRDGIIQPA